MTLTRKTNIIGKFLIILSLLLWATCAHAQNTVFVPSCTGNATNDTAKIAALVTAIGTNTGTIRLPYKAGTSWCTVNDLAIPANVTLDNSDGAGIYISSGKVLTVLGDVVNPRGKIVFRHALSGQGTVSFAGNTSLTEISPDWWGTARNGSTDDSAPIQASLVAIRDRGHGILKFTPTGNYKINSTVTLEALAADIAQPIVLSGYGATITVNTTGTPGLQIKNVTAGRSFDHWIVEGFSFVGTGTESDIISVLNTTTSFSNNWQIRDIVIQVTTGHGIHVDSSGAGSGYGAFQFQISNCHIELGSANTTKNGIYLDSLAGRISSAELNYNTTNHGKHGIEGSSPASIHITGGTVLSAAQEGIFITVQSGLVIGVHIENSWVNTPAGTGGAQLYIEGWCDVIGLEEGRAADAGARWAIDTYNYGGPLNIIGRRNTKMSSTTPYVHIRKALTTGSVNLIGIEPDEVDATAVDDINNPKIHYIGSPNGGPALQTSGGVIIGNTGITLPGGAQVVEGRLATVTGVNLNTATATTLYTCPTGKTCVITRVVVSAPSTSLTTASWCYGWESATFTNVINTATHTELTGATLYTTLFPKVGAVLGSSGGTFKTLNTILQGGVATVRMDVYGYNY